MAAQSVPMRSHCFDPHTVQECIRQLEAAGRCPGRCFLGQFFGCLDVLRGPGVPDCCLP